jgi:hypothetical protein
MLMVDKKMVLKELILLRGGAKVGLNLSQGFCVKFNFVLPPT